LILGGSLQSSVNISMNTRARTSVRTLRNLPQLLAAVILLAGCATPSTIETRRTEKLLAYQSLPPEERELVDAGQIKVGMSQDAVYIAWGKPSEVLEREDAQGRISSWRYYGSWMQETRYWTFREARGRRGDIFLERYLATDYDSRDYVRAEIQFQEGKVLAWGTLPRPTY